MVRCFLIHTVCPVAALGAADSRVLYSRLFGPDEAVVSEQQRELSPEQRRLLQKEKIAAVARSVCCGVSFNIYAARPFRKSCIRHLVCLLSGNNLAEYERGRQR